MEDKKLRRTLVQIRDVLERFEISGINRKLQMKPLKWLDSEDGKCEAVEVQLILKWGGDLTRYGREQAEALGANFRIGMYPDPQGGGVLRLHSTYRHDLKIKASDEGRVMKTAAAFAKGLLELEGQLTPILASLVTVEEKNKQLLDRGGNYEIEEDMARCKEHLNKLQIDQVMTEEYIQNIAPDCTPAVKAAILSLKNPLQTLQRVHELIKQLCNQLEDICEEEKSTAIAINAKDIDEGDTPVDIVPENAMCSWNEKDDTTSSLSKSFRSSSDPEARKLYNNETTVLMLDRWLKLAKDFFDTKKDMFDLTKVPDIYDMIRYDSLHNSHINLKGMEELLRLSTSFENTVVPQEYGMYYKL